MYKSWKYIFHIVVSVKLSSLLHKSSEVIKIQCSYGNYFQLNFKWGNPVNQLDLTSDVCDPCWRKSEEKVCVCEIKRLKITSLILIGSSNLITLTQTCTGYSFHTTMLAKCWFFTLKWGHGLQQSRWFSLTIRGNKVKTVLLAVSSHHS